MWKLVDVQIIYKKLYQRELVTSDWFFVIRNSSGVQIFRNDEKARQRHLPKMYTLVVTMNWNRFRKMFRIRFCIFYNRSELTHCMEESLRDPRGLASDGGSTPFPLLTSYIVCNTHFNFWTANNRLFFVFNVSRSLSAHIFFSYLFCVFRHFVNFQQIFL